jgi:hypothetical protein
LKWINIHLLWPQLKILRPYLPRSIFSQIERILKKPIPTKEQLSEITRLGESIGLQRNEIIAAIDAPLTNQGVQGIRRTSFFIPMILISILVVVSLLIVWAMFDPESFPIHTYTPGTFYGTIRPQDF